MKNIKVMLADDHELVSRGIKELLSTKGNGIDVVKVVNSTNNICEEYYQAQPDVLILDVRFCGENRTDSGFIACEQVLDNYPSAKIVILSQFDSDYVIKKSYQLGAYAFICKNDNMDEFVDGIKSAYEGERYFSPGVARQMASYSIEPSIESLNEREIKIFKLVADGMTQKEISEQENLSVKTVNWIIADIKNKLKLNRPTDFTKLAMLHNLVDVN